MGRVCKRVPLDFSWPLKETWIGFVNPYAGVKCPYCENGYSEKAQEIKEQVYARDYKYLMKNPYRNDGMYFSNAKEHNMTQDEVDYFMEHQHKNTIQEIQQVISRHFPVATKITPEIFSKLCLIMSDFPHNLDFQMICYHSEKEGWDPECKHCNGEGVLYLNEEIKRLHEDFEYVEPPTGEGYQIWETTSDGSPITPVFKTAEELAEYCEREGVSWFGSSTNTKDNWLRLINKSVPAAVEVAPGVVIM